MACKYCDAPKTYEYARINNIRVCAYHWSKIYRQKVPDYIPNLQRSQYKVKLYEKENI